jgi:NADP-dependent 3-hydroxy acid dehydrogenase YdfG
MKIAICDRNLDGLEETARLISGVNKDIEVLQVSVDLKNGTQVESMISQAVSTFGRVDYAANTESPALGCQYLQSPSEYGSTEYLPRCGGR